MKALLISLFFISSAFGFTLNSNTGRGFSDNEIDIVIANNDCTGAGFTVQKYKSMIENAVEEFWNRVPTSSLVLNVKGIDTSIDLSSDTHSTGLTKTANKTILAGCNASTANGFDDGSILGSAVMQCTGDNCKAILLLNANSASYLRNYSDSEIEVVIAHEIGHAFGLGHSEYEFNLMYYAVGNKSQDWLGIDDIDAVSYLYPHEGTSDPLIGIPLLGSCGTINLDNENLDNDNQGQGPMKSLSIGLLLFILLRFFTRLLTQRLRN